MTINKNTGGVTFDELGVCVESSLTRSKFLAAPVFLNAEVVVKNEPFCSFSIPRVPQADTELCVTFQFQGERLAHMVLCHSASRFGTSWDNWSEQRELARKAFHDNWLVHKVQVVPGSYLWGSVCSAFDQKTGGASILITYQA